MSKNLQAVDKLSEFPPLSPELDDSGVNFIFNFFKFGEFAWAYKNTTVIYQQSFYVRRQRQEQWAKGCVRESGHHSCSGVGAQGAGEPGQRSDGHLAHKHR